MSHKNNTNEQKMQAPEEVVIPDMPRPPKDDGLSLGAKMLLGVLGLFVVLVGGLTAFVYASEPTDEAVRKIVQEVPYPAVIIDGEPISMREYLAERDAVLNFYEQSNGEQDISNLETDVMETLVNKVVVRQLAAEYGITLNQERVDAMLGQISGGQPEAFQEQLQQQLGWTESEFKDRVLESVVLASQMSEHIAGSDEVQAQREQQAEEALRQIEEGKSFGEVAATLQEETEAVQSGDLGAIKTKTLPEAWRDSVTSLEVGAHSDVIAGETAFYVFRVNDKMNAGEDSEIDLSAVVVPKLTLSEVVDAHLADVKVWELI